MLIAKDGSSARFITDIDAYNKLVGYVDVDSDSDVDVSNSCVSPLASMGASEQDSSSSSSNIWWETLLESSAAFAPWPWSSIVWGPHASGTPLGTGEEQRQHDDDDDDGLAELLVLCGVVE